MQEGGAQGLGCPGANSLVKLPLKQHPDPPPPTFGFLVAWVYRGTNLWCGRIPGQSSIIHNEYSLSTHHTLGSLILSERVLEAVQGSAQGDLPDSSLNFAPSLAPFPGFLLIQKKQQQTVPSPLPPPASSLPAVWQGKRLGCPGDYLTPRAKGRAVWAGSRAPGDPSPARARPGSPQPEPPAPGPCARGAGGGAECRQPTRPRHGHSHPFSKPQFPAL